LDQDRLALVRGIKGATITFIRFITVLTYRNNNNIFTYFIFYVVKYSENKLKLYKNTMIYWKIYNNIFIYMVAP